MHRIVLCCFLAVLSVLELVPCDAQKLTTIAGNGTAGTSDNVIDQPFGLRIGPDGGLYFCDVGNHRIYRLDLHTREIAIIAGSGQKGNSGDGTPAPGALLDEPYELAFDKAGNLFFCDRLGDVVRRVDRVSYEISTVVGNGEQGYYGDGGPAVKAQLWQPHSILFAPDGHLLICDILNYRIRNFDPVSGLISTWAGTGKPGKAEDGAPIQGTPLDGPRALAIDKAGNYYLCLLYTSPS